MDKIVFKNLDGSVGVIAPSPRWKGTLEELATKDVPDGLEWRIVDESQLPQDRTFRDAWTDDNPTDTVDVDIVKAREIQKGYIRQEREPLLKELDIRQLRGEDVEAEKQGLRDFTKRVDGVTNLDELKLILPK